MGLRKGVCQEINLFSCPGKQHLSSSGRSARHGDGDGNAFAPFGDSLQQREETAWTGEKRGWTHAVEARCFPCAERRKFFARNSMNDKKMWFNYNSRHFGVYCLMVTKNAIDCEIACDCVRHANVVIGLRKEISARTHTCTATHKFTTAQHLKGSVEWSRHERHFCSLLPYFLLSWLQIFQLCLSFWTSSFDLVLFKKFLQGKEKYPKNLPKRLSS